MTLILGIDGQEAAASPGYNDASASNNDAAATVGNSQDYDAPGPGGTLLKAIDGGLLAGASTYLALTTPIGIAANGAGYVGFFADTPTNSGGILGGVSNHDFLEMDTSIAIGGDAWFQNISGLSTSGFHHYGLNFKTDGSIDLYVDAVLIGPLVGDLRNASWAFNALLYDGNNGNTDAKCCGYRARNALATPTEIAADYAEGVTPPPDTTPILVPASFANLAPYDQLFIVNQSFADTPGTSVPFPLTWNTTAPVGLIDWSAVAVAADNGATTRIVDAGGTLISATYVVAANHFVGSKWYFMKPDGTEVSRTVAASTRIGSTDLQVVKLSSAVTGITPMPVLLDSSRIAGRLCLADEANRHLNLCRIAANHSNSQQETIIAPTTVDVIEAGDSGKPCIVIVNGRLVMAMSALQGSTNGPNPSAFITEINAILAADGEALTVWDLRAGGAGSSVTSSIQSSIYPSVVGSFVGCPQDDEDD